MLRLARSVSAVVPSFVATACSAARSDGCAGRCSITSRMVLSRTSGESRVRRPIDPIRRDDVAENPSTHSLAHVGFVTREHLTFSGLHVNNVVAGRALRDGSRLLPSRYQLLLASKPAQRSPSERPAYTTRERC